VFGPEDKTKKIYKELVRPITEKVLSQRVNGTVFAYGQTLSGKTYTMLGELARVNNAQSNVVSNSDELGIVQMCLVDVFKALMKEPDSYLSLSYLEVYNENVFDLLMKD